MTDFDEHAATYERTLSSALGMFGATTEYYAEHKVRIVRRVVGTRPSRILEFGCGIGNNIRYLGRAFPGAAIAGCDVSRESLALAREQNPGCDFFLANEEEMAGRAGAFDLVIAANVFHHIKLASRADAMGAIYTMMAAGAVFAIFEHNPFNPVTRRVVKTCPWDADAILLPIGEAVGLVRGAGLTVFQRRYTLFFPGPLRALDFLDWPLGSVPVGGQYFVFGRKS